MKRVLILTGGHLDPAFAGQMILSLAYDTVYAVDKGLQYADALGLMPDYIVGDFDTVDTEILERYEQRIYNGEIAAFLDRYPAKKDATDTEIAVSHAIAEHADVIYLLGGTGSRMDHVLANIGLLLQTAEAEIDCQLIDETNRIRLLDGAHQKSCRICKTEQYGSYLSLIPLTGHVTGVSLRGVAYPGEDLILTAGSSLTVSNEITEQEAVIAIGQGRVLVIESKD